MENRPILVVEDDQAVREMIAMAVEEILGIPAIQAASGDEALERISGDRPGLVLLDLRLPTLDGFEVLRRLKADPTTRDLPVIVLTTASLPHDRERARRLGCQAYLDKPFEIDELLNLLRTQLGLPPPGGVKA